MSRVIVTSTVEDTLASLELASEFFDHAIDDDRYWKWFVVALHAGIQGTFVLALERGNAFLVQKPGVTQRMLAAHDTGAPMPDAHQDNFLRLYSKTCLLRGEAEDDSTAREALTGLDGLRDEFQHFNAKSWLIEKDLVLRHARASFAVACRLLLDQNSVRIYEEADALRAKEAVQDLTTRLQIAA